MNKSTLSVIFGILAIVSFSIYWFGVRPGEVRKNCWNQAKMHASNVSAMEARIIERSMNVTRADYEKVREDEYRTCLLNHGLAK